MRLQTTSFDADGPIPAEFAFCDIDPESHVAMAPNRNPQLQWSDVPDGTRSFVLICHDPDVPSRPDDVNQEGRQVPADLPRVDFYHWILVDLPASKREIASGEFCDGVTARGKSGPDASGGIRHGLNNYTQWFEGDPDMEGKYFGYDGPCPPWNDTLIHHYHFTVYALDVEKCPVEGEFTGPDVLAAIEGHVLASAEIVGTYTLNPSLR